MSYSGYPRSSLAAIREEMARQGLSGRDLAHLLGVTEGRVSQMLKGDRTLRSVAWLLSAPAPGGAVSG